jgi:hypothetical protein
VIAMLPLALLKLRLKPTRLKIAMKSEYRISKSETNSNVQNQHDWFHSPQSLLVLDFEHLNFDIVSDFGFGIWDLGFRILTKKLDSFFPLLPDEDG